MRRMVVAATALIAVTYGLARFALGLFVPEIRSEFDLSATAVGLVMGASFAGYLAGLVLAGPLVERAGPRTVGWSSGLVATAGIAGVAMSPHPLLLGLAAGVGGVSTGLASPALAAAVIDRIPPGRRDASQTVINSGTSVGLVVAVPVAVVAASWRAAWVVFAIAALAATFGLVAAMPAGRPPPSAAAPRPGPRPLSSRLRVAAILLGASSAVFWSFGRDLLETVSGLQPAVSRMAWVAVGATGLLGAFAGLLARLVGLRRAVAGTGVVLATSLALLATGPRSVVIALGATGAFGAAYMAMTGLLIVWSVRERPQEPASGVAMAFLLLAAGQLVGSPLAGTIGDRFGLATSFYVAATVAAGTALVLPAGTAGADLAHHSHHKAPTPRPKEHADDGDLGTAPNVRQRAGPDPVGHAG